MQIDTRPTLPQAAMPSLEHHAATEENSNRRYAFVAFCLLIVMLLVIKYYPLKPTLYVLSTYLWTIDTGDFRRTAISSIAALSHEFKPDRMLPVIDLVSFVELAGLIQMLAWASVKLAGRELPRLGLLLLLCSGAAPHLLATRGYPDGFAAMALMCFALACNRGIIWLSVVAGAVAVAIHEASIFYVASICGLRVVLTDADPSTRWKDICGRLTSPALLPAIAGFAAAALTLAGLLAVPVAPADHIADMCQHYSFLATAAGLPVLRSVDAGSLSEQWSGVCGLQFKVFASSPGYFVRSFPLGSMFAPLVLLVILIGLRSRLSWGLRLGAVASLLLPALLPLVASDVTRFWSYMNFTAFYGLLLFEPHAPVLANTRTRAGLRAVLALWAVVAVVINQWPTGWPQPPGPLPDSIAIHFPTFRDLICGVSRRGVCEKPVAVLN